MFKQNTTAKINAVNKEMNKRILKSIGGKSVMEKKIVLSARKKHVHNSRIMSKIKTPREHLLKVKGFKLQRQNDTRLSDDKNKDEGLYNEIKAWKPTSGS